MPISIYESFEPQYTVILSLKHYISILLTAQMHTHTCTLHPSKHILCIMRFAQIMHIGCPFFNTFWTFMLCILKYMIFHTNLTNSLAFCYMHESRHVSCIIHVKMRFHVWFTGMPDIPHILNVERSTSSDLRFFDFQRIPMSRGEKNLEITETIEQVNKTSFEVHQLLKYHSTTQLMWQNIRISSLFLVHRPM